MSSFDGLSISLGSYTAGCYLLACSYLELSLVNIFNGVRSFLESMKDEFNSIVY